ncbi:MAG: multidrug efflux pump subunit AcrB [Flavobacteriales bacterium]|jgi:multidrug efflux pump subunit AcrB
MIAWFTRNDVAANLLMISIALAGAWSLFTQIPLEFFPSFESEQIDVKVNLRGATPEDAELALAIRIEEAIKSIEGLEQYSSRSVEGGATVSIEIAKGYEAREILDDVKNRVDAINTFPADAERPVISLAQRIYPVVSLSISGDLSEEEIRELSEQTREDLLKIPGISHINLEGIRDYEIAIELHQDALREHDIELSQISDAIAKNSLDLSAGNVKTAGGNILIRTKAQAYRKSAFEQIIVKTQTNGQVLRVKDVATVIDGFEESATRTRFNGKPAAKLEVHRIGKQSAIDISNKVKHYVAQKRTRLPSLIHIDYWNDRAEIIKKRINTLTRNAIQGGILVILLLSLFLRPAVAVWVFLGIPISFLGAFLVMPFLGVSLNMISLFAFIIVLGIVVDDAIVTGENIYRHLEGSDSGLEAAIRGTKEVAIPVTFGVLTTIAAFIPLAFLDTGRGPLFAQIPLIVVPVLIFSLIESKFVLPAHLKYLKVGRDKKLGRFSRFQQKFSRGFEQSILRYYQPVLIFCLQRKAATTLAFCGTLCCIVFALNLGHIRFVFFPRIPSEHLRLNIEMPIGTPFEVTDSHMEHVLDTIITLQNKYRDADSGESIIHNILTQTGNRGGASHRASARFQVAAPEKRSIDIDSRELMREWRKMIGTIPGIERLSYRAEIGRSGDPIDVELRSNNLKTLELASHKVQQRLSTYEGIFDIYDSLANGKQELKIDLKAEAELLGLSRQDIIQQLRHAFFGLQAQRIQRGRDDIRVMVRFKLSERRSLNDLHNMLIKGPQGQAVPLSQLATITAGVSASSIDRVDGYRSVNVRADIEKQRVNMAVLNQDLKQFLEQLTQSYPDLSYRFGGEQEEQADTNRSMTTSIIALTFVIYCLLAIPFKSYLQPLVIIAIIPFGIIGAVLGHWIMAVDLTLMSYMGMLALSGVLVNDSLVLVDYMNKSRAKGMALMDAVINAGAARFRPVILTSMTTFLGLMPLLFEKETQAQFLIPMAISLGFGIIFTTFITLLLVPVFYLSLEYAKQTIKTIRT